MGNIPVNFFKFKVVGQISFQECLGQGQLWTVLALKGHNFVVSCQWLIQRGFTLEGLMED